ncbi:hypothetical protein DVK05_04655 [Halorubrum sp. Atlit-8R]|uniref:sulfatase-like hydrolase/transferase n=1 Tax=unclassified Halorubrum TaxID=2642239 RepID=UPI000EF1B968|nr:MULTISPECIES: sulfatase-like hydrolase/transferase [unclassified Halorubrum]RLM70764.1 hypothetical protein DVK08_01105 [Halorubrum sp. Atlit-9R]RLM71632.1 hypothetical protein DVK08_05845 [Halorubrum sp. Atlit-9R]RLM83083.1 hypothetical protein DVK05_04655 [Halorubrum sp. Atlit-8R]
MTNIPLVTVDSLRADHFGHYGYDRDTSPVIDSLAADGLSFVAYTNVSWTRASFPSIITSTYHLEYRGFEHLSDGWPSPRQSDGGTTRVRPSPGTEGSLGITTAAVDTITSMTPGPIRRCWRGPARS